MSALQLPTTMYERDPSRYLPLALESKNLSLRPIKNTEGQECKHFYDIPNRRQYHHIVSNNGQYEISGVVHKIVLLIENLSTKTVGLIHYSFDPEEEEYRVVYLKVDENCRKSGYGSVLLGHAIREAQEQEWCKQVSLVSEVAGYYLYAKFGFLPEDADPDTWEIGDYKAYCEYLKEYRVKSMVLMLTSTKIQEMINHRLRMVSMGQHTDPSEDHFSLSQT